MGATQSVALPPVAEPSSAEPSSAEPLCAQHLLLPVIGKNDAVNLHARSCSVRVKEIPHVCGCAKLSVFQHMIVMEGIHKCMRTDYIAFARFILDGDDAAAKLAKLQEMQVFAKENLQTTMPVPTAADVEVLRQYFEPHRRYLFPPK
jgi:hypothetical protein